MVLPLKTFVMTDSCVSFPPWVVFSIVRRGVYECVPNAHAMVVVVMISSPPPEREGGSINPIQILHQKGQ